MCVGGGGGGFLFHCISAFEKFQVILFSSLYMVLPVILLMLIGLCKLVYANEEQQYGSMQCNLALWEMTSYVDLQRIRHVQKVAEVCVCECVCV